MFNILPDFSGAVRLNGMSKGLLMLVDGYMSTGEGIAAIEEFTRLVRSGYCNDELQKFPWLKDISHLARVNKYRKRVGQKLIKLSDSDVVDLSLTSR